MTKHKPSKPSDQNTGSRQQREVYETPHITFIKLVAEEALMGICKNGIATGPAGACVTGCRGGGS